MPLCSSILRCASISCSVTDSVTILIKLSKCKSNCQNINQIVTISTWPCEYSILDSNSEFFVLLKLDSDQTLLGPSSEYYKHKDFHDYFNNYSEVAGHGEDISG